MNKSIIVIGGGGHSKVLISILIKNQEFEIIGYTDNFDKGDVLNVQYLGTDEYLKNFSNQNINIAIGIGLIRNFDSRLKIISKFIDMNYIFPAIISKNAIKNEDVLISIGSVLFDGVVVNSGTQIGKFSILNTKCSIDHDCKIGDNVHVAPGTTICGDVSIGNNSLVGAGSTIVNGLKICSDVTIGAGSVVTKNITEPGTYVGIPAKRVK